MIRPKLAFLFCARVLGLFALARFLTRRGVRVLCYHAVWLGEDEFAGDGMFMKPATFLRRLHTLRRLGYEVVDLDDAVNALSGRADLGSCPVVITVDDGWYSTFSVMLPELVRLGMSATLYCDTDQLLRKQPIPHVMAAHISKRLDTSSLSCESRAMLARAADLSLSFDERLECLRRFTAGHTEDLEYFFRRRAFDYMSPEELRVFARSPRMRVELHTHRHTMHDHSKTMISREIEDNRSALSSLLHVPGSRFSHFCYPSGDVDVNDRSILESCGVKSATTTQQGIAVFDPGAIHRIPRILDGENVSMIEFEAELSGFLYLARRLIRTSKAVVSCFG